MMMLVIGARAVVSKDVEPYSIVAGSPLKHLQYRFPKDIRDTLVEKKWGIYQMRK